MAELSDKELGSVQVIQEIEDKNVMRVYNIVSAHIGDENDLLTTIELDGTYEEVDLT